MRTSEFPYYRPPFPEFNPVQSAVVPHLDKNVNIVVSFATAAGKTVLAECCFGFHLSVSTGRVCYVCPYKSLASEKYHEWEENPHFRSEGIVLGTSDTVTDVADFESARIAVVTSEAFDSKTRSKVYRPWLKSLTCVAFDEAHLIGEKGRGAAVEASMMRFSLINPLARMILLSATMGNATEVARWVKSLNGKETKCVTSSWRPTTVHVEYLPVEEYDEKVSEAVRLAAEASCSKTVVFVHSKVTGAQVAKGLRARGVPAVFHNASVKAGRRKRMEALFNDKMSGMNVLVSTSTLSAGVNIGN